MVEIVPALPEEADALRARQLTAIRRFLEAVVANRKATGVSGLAGNVKRKIEMERKTQERAEGGAR